MAPQNSTLIDEHSLMSPTTLMNSPDELRRYSPILPPKHRQQQQQIGDTRGCNNPEGDNKLESNNIKLGNRHGNNKNNNNNKDHKHHHKNNKTPANAAQLRNEQQHKAPKPQQQTRTASEQQPKHPSTTEQQQQKAAVAHSRSISLHGMNSTLQKGQKEITIWLACGEPRYVSGVTSKTTCNDLIKALIDDDELAATATGAAASTNWKRPDNVAKNAGSRDYSDYVLTEFWRGIERSYDGNMAILPVWKAWSRVPNELRLTLKRRQDIQTPPKIAKSPGALTALRKYLGKIFVSTSRRRNSEKKRKQQRQEQRQSCAESNERAAEFLLSDREHKIPDEFLFVILPENCQCPKHGKHSEAAAMPLIDGALLRPGSGKLLSERFYRLSESRSLSTKRKSRSARKSIGDSCSSFSKARQSTRQSHKSKKQKSQQHAKKPRRRGSTMIGSETELQLRKDIARGHTASIRSKLAQKTSQMNGLYEREQALTKQLSDKCRLFKLQNELYTHADKRLELSVGEIQGTVEQYATDIIRTEQQLLYLKNEIRQDISLINNLKRLTLTADVNGKLDEQRESQQQQKAEETFTVAKLDKKVATPKQQRSEMQFVDNIYEFCDNNGSMLV